MKSFAKSYRMTLAVFLSLLVFNPTHVVARHDGTHEAVEKIKTIENSSDAALLAIFGLDLFISRNATKREVAEVFRKQYDASLTGSEWRKDEVKREVALEALVFTATQHAMRDYDDFLLSQQKKYATILAANLTRSELESFRQHAVSKIGQIDFLDDAIPSGTDHADYNLSKDKITQVAIKAFYENDLGQKINKHALAFFQDFYAARAKFFETRWAKSQDYTQRNWEDEFRLRMGGKTGSAVAKMEWAHTHIDRFKRHRTLDTARLWRRDEALKRLKAE